MCTALSGLLKDDCILTFSTYENSQDSIAETTASSARDCPLKFA